MSLRIGNLMLILLRSNVESATSGVLRPGINSYYYAFSVVSTAVATPRVADINLDLRSSRLLPARVLPIDRNVKATDWCTAVGASLSTKYVDLQRGLAAPSARARSTESRNRK